MPYIKVQETPYLSQIALLTEMSRNVSRHLNCIEISQDIKADGELSCEIHKTINVSVCFCDLYPQGLLLCSHARSCGAEPQHDE